MRRTWGDRARWTAALVTVVTTTVLATGCARGREEPPGGAALVSDPLTGRTFLSQSVEVDGEPYPLVDGTRIMIRFSEDGQLTANAGCNTLGATVATDGGRLTVSGVGGTEMGCDPALHTQDTWLATFLSEGPQWSYADGRLTLTRDTTTIVLLERGLADPDRALAGTRWLVDTLVEGETASSLPVGADDSAWLLIEGDTFTAYTACREVSGTVEVGADTLTFGDVAQTDPACPPDLAELDELMLRVLSGESVGYAVEGARLRLDHPDGIGLGLHADE